MYHDIQAQKGRFLLRILLWLIFIAQFGQALVPLIRAGSAAPSALLAAAAPLLPSAVILWALHRGNRAALVLFVIAGILQLGDFSYWLLPQYQEFMAPVDALDGAALLLSVIELLLRLSVLYQLFSGSSIPSWLEYRRDMRRRKDLVLELVLFALSLLPSLPLLFLLSFSVLLP